MSQYNIDPYRAINHIDIDIPTKIRTNDTLFSSSVLYSRTYNTLVLTSVSMVLHKVGLTVHWS